jgi:hypothetical protein
MTNGSPKAKNRYTGYNLNSYFGSAEYLKLGFADTSQ